MPMQNSIKVSCELEREYADKLIKRIKSYKRSDVILSDVSECFNKIYAEIIAPISIINALNNYIDQMERGEL